jgi:hypothetical protein
VPGEDRVEPRVAVDVRPDRVQTDAVAERAEALDRGLARGRVEVVELAARHQEVARDRVALRLQLCHLHRRLQREVDVVTQQQLSRFRWMVEVRKPVPAGVRRLEQLAVVGEIERAGGGHSVST